ncbi:hypothetical protein V6N11_024837 [Hibiscus sabdariffa]|uniref:Uncharacterized protein n=1 Tax=Hibiscus sabdariffa TaxID=183260 RepID=A0ABR2QNG6_9ROSI
MPRIPIIFQTILPVFKAEQIDSVILRHPVAVVSAAIIHEELIVYPEDVEVLLPTAPPHVARKFCPGEEIGAKRPVKLTMDRDAAESEIIIFGSAVSFKRLGCAVKPVDDVNMALIHDRVGHE